MGYGHHFKKFWKCLQSLSNLKLPTPSFTTPHVPPRIVSTIGRLTYKTSIIFIQSFKIFMCFCKRVPKFDLQHALCSMITQKNTTYVCSCYGWSDWASALFQLLKTLKIHNLQETLDKETECIVSWHCDSNWGASFTTCTCKWENNYSQALKNFHPQGQHYILCNCASNKL
jgi:hypothetical protein